VFSSQRVGASKYAVQPRYVRPPEQPKTELQRLMLKAGAVATANVLSSRFSSEGILERGQSFYVNRHCCAICCVVKNDELCVRG
jgi:hypothetical protein